jgi:hypothetical protein
MRPGGLGRWLVAAGAILACAAFALAPAPATAKKRTLGPVVTSKGYADPIATNVTALARCPKKMAAVGGGWKAPFSAEDGFWGVYRSERAGKNGWETSAHVFADAGGRYMTTYVHCQRIKKPILDVAETGTAGAGFFALGNAVASCPGKKKLISGGFSSDVGGTPSALAFPYANSASGKSWAYSAVNNSSEARTLTSHAYCSKGVKAAKPVSSISEGSVARQGSLSASSPGCSRKKHLPSGGFSIMPSPARGGLVPTVVESRIKARTWFTRVAQFASDTVQATVTSQAICTK